MMSLVFSITPPKPIDRYIYLCDKNFHIEHLIPLYNTFETNGLIVITGEEIKMYELTGTEVKCVKKDRVRLPKSHKKGGQSAQRIGRIRDEKVHTYITICNEFVEKLWFKEGNLGVSKIVLAGNSVKKDLLYDEFNEKIRQKTLKMTIDEMDLQVFDKVREYLVSIDSKINTHLEEFLEHIRLDTGKAIYGKDIMKEYIETRQLQKILIHENHCEFDAYKDNDNTEIIKKDDKGATTFLTGYGGLAGIAYYQRDF